MVEVLESVKVIRWEREPYTPTDWRGLQLRADGREHIVNVDSVAAAGVLAVPYDVAEAQGWLSDTIEVESGEVLPCVGEDDEMRVLLAAMPVAVVLRRVCTGMGVAVPELVQRAYDQIMIEPT